MIWLHRYARLLVAATLLLVAAGGMVTSTSSGLSVPDWPTTYGYSMFSFPLSNMVGGIFYEHGHRLIASTVGFLTIGLVVFLWRVEPRRWMRRLGLVALGGGHPAGRARRPDRAVLPAGADLDRPCRPRAAVLLPDGQHRAVHVTGLANAGAAARSTTRGCADGRRLLTVVVYTQILLGATMRHLGAGLAIPDFPLVVRTPPAAGLAAARSRFTSRTASARS